MLEVEVEVSNEDVEAAGRRTVPMFNGKRRRLSPMMTKWYAEFGVVRIGSERILTPSEMDRVMEMPRVRGSHKDMRENWEGSAPQQFSDSQIGLFSYSVTNADVMTYLVWGPSEKEPQIWRYSGMQEDRFDDILHFLKWLAGDRESNWNES